MVCDAVLEDEDAEEFLGQTAAAFVDDLDVQEKLQHDLQRLRDSGQEFVVRIKNYLVDSHKRRRVDSPSIPSSTENVPLQNQLGIFRTKAPFCCEKQ